MMKTIKIIYCLSAFILFLSPTYAQYIASSPITLSGASNQTISGKEFTSGTNGISLYLTNCKNIKITNCRFVNIPAYVGIQLQSCSNIEIVDCYFENFRGGVYAVNSSAINVHCNSFKTIAGPKPRGQIVQFNNVSGSGNRINYNISEHILGTGYPEDLINLYSSSGTSADPLQVVGNKLRGGGPSTSGGGIMIGDNGGHDFLIADNIIVNPGQYGIGVPAGTNITVKNNKIYAKKQSFTNIGLYVGLSSEIAAGYPCNGSTITVEGNQVNWTNKNGIKNGYYNCSCCPGVVLSGNNFNAPIDSTILPATLTLNTTMCSSSSVNVAPTVSISSPANNASFTANANITITANASDSDGSVSKVDFYNGSTLIGTDASAPYSFTWSSVAAGTYTIKAKATDNSGASTTSSAVTVVVNPAVTTNVAPSVTITAPANNTSFTASANIAISANATDSDGSVSKVDFYNGSTLLGSDVSSPYSYDWTNVAAGSYTIKVTATDNKGAQTTKSITVTVSNPATTSTIGINGNSCIAAGGSYSYYIVPDKYATTYGWWSNTGATITQDASDPKKITIQIPSYMNGTSFTLSCGVNFSASPWYKEYDKTIKVGGCSAKITAIVSPVNTDGSATLGIDNGEKIQTVEIYNTQGALVYKMENINMYSVPVGLNLASGIYIVHIQSESGSSMAKFIK